MTENCQLTAKLWNCQLSTANCQIAPASPYRHALKIAAALIILITCIALLQLSAAAYFSQVKLPLEKANLVIVFPGEGERVKTGCKIVRDGFADNLMVISETPEKLRKLMRAQGVPEKVAALAGGVSRSSFEDAYNSAQSIKKNGFASVILVTSSYHLPRAYLLLSGLLAGKVKTLSIQCYPAEQDKEMKLSRKVRLYYNEVVKLWGSSTEMLGYFLTNQLPLDSPDTSRLRLFVKSHVLLKV